MQATAEIYTIKINVINIDCPITIISPDKRVQKQSARDWNSNGISTSFDLPRRNTQEKTMSFYMPIRNNLE